MFLNAELIHALEPSERRCYNRREAASYVGVSPGTFDKLVRKGLLPSSIEFLGRKVWDRGALDAALDLISNVRSSRPTAATSALDAWRNSRG